MAIPSSDEATRTIAALKRQAGTLAGELEDANKEVRDLKDRVKKLEIVLMGDPSLQVTGVSTKATENAIRIGTIEALIKTAQDSIRAWRWVIGVLGATNAATVWAYIAQLFK